MLSFNNLRANSRRNLRQRRMRPVRPSHKTELWYKSELLKLVKTIRRQVEPELIRFIKSNPVADGFVADATAREVAFKALLTKLSNKMGGIQAIAERLARLAVERNVKEVDSGLIASIRAAIGVNIAGQLSRTGAVSVAMRNATTNNVDLIKSIPTKYFDKLTKVITKNFQQGMRFEALIPQIQDVGKVTESRAKLIARDQTSKMNSSFNEARQKALGIEKYVWQTSGDERVRPEHAENDGKTFSWSSPPATGHPGEDIQCRCVAIPVFDLDAMEAELGIGPGRAPAENELQPTSSQLFPGVNR
jgi:SPP1 gp7 family putative phage head morphogenesis protein